MKRVKIKIFFLFETNTKSRSDLDCFKMFTKVKLVQKSGNS